MEFRRRIRLAFRLLWCAAGAGVGLGLALLIAGPGHSPFLFASLGGSAVFLFGLGNAPATQPRALFGGHLGSALIGIVCAQYLGSSMWVYALAQALTLVFMISCRTVHPPAGANALIMVHAHAGFDALLQPVLVGAICLAGSAFVWSRLWRGTVRYPISWVAGSLPVDWGSQACGIDGQLIQQSEHSKHQQLRFAKKAQTMLHVAGEGANRAVRDDHRFDADCVAGAAARLRAADASAAAQVMEAPAAPEKPLHPATGTCGG